MWSVAFYMVALILGVVQIVRTNAQDLSAWAITAIALGLLIAAGISRLG